MNEFLLYKIIFFLLMIFVSSFYFDTLKTILKNIILFNVILLVFFAYCILNNKVSVVIFIITIFICFMYSLLVNLILEKEKEDK